MKPSLFFLFITCLVLCACSKKNATPEIPLDEKIAADSTVTAVFTGAFMNGPYGTVSGSAKIVKQGGNYILALDSMNISNGPALHVYLSQEVQPVHFIDLGSLKSTRGNQLYPVPAMPDFNLYKYALVHCQQYNHLFGSATLK